MHDPIDTESTPERQTAPAGTVFMVGLICLGVATLLNSASLLETARRLPSDDPMRTVAVSVMERVAAFSRWSRLDVPRELVDTAVGRGDSPAAEVVAGDAVAESESSTTTAAAVSTTAVATGDTGAGTTSIPTTTMGTAASTTTTTTTTLPLRSLATADDPMRLWIIGDSLANLFGSELASLALDTGVVTPTIEFRVSSGLIHYYYFDWPARIRARMPELQPDVVVVQLGGNDSQDITRDGVRIEVLTPQWVPEYRRLVGEAMDLLLSQGASHVYWVGLPIMRSESLTLKVIDINSAYQAEAAERPGVTYVSAFELFADESGEYSTYLRDFDGELRRMRTGDGEHFEAAGARRLAIQVMRFITRDWDLGVDFGPIVACPPSC